MPVKIINNFKNLSSAPLLQQLLDDARKNSKGLTCPNHPNAESTLKLSLKDGKPKKDLMACCEDFAETITYELSYQGHLDRQNQL